MSKYLNVGSIASYVLDERCVLLLGNKAYNVLIDSNSSVVLMHITDGSGEMVFSKDKDYDVKDIRAYKRLDSSFDAFQFVNKFNSIKNNKDNNSVGIRDGSGSDALIDMEVYDSNGYSWDWSISDMYVGISIDSVDNTYDYDYDFDFDNTFF